VKELNMTFIDGSAEEQSKAVENYLNSISDEEHNRAMSDEFRYLDEE
jgi:hypothetical protein